MQHPTTEEPAEDTADAADHAEDTADAAEDTADAADATTPIRQARWSALDAVTGYRIAALRSAVFVVEQRCAYLDLDGRDLEPGATQLWCEGPDGAVLAALRVLDDGGARRIGRVVTAPEARGRGLAGRLLRRVLEGEGPFVLDAQSHLTAWYGGFGFTPSGEEFVEDGIPHTPMRRP